MQILSTEFRLQFTLLGSAPGNFGRNVRFQELTPSFQTAFRFDKVTQLTWSDSRGWGEENRGSPDQGQESVFQDVPVLGV